MRSTITKVKEVPAGSLNPTDTFMSDDQYFIFLLNEYGLRILRKGYYEVINLTSQQVRRLNKDVEVTPCLVELNIINT